MKKILAILMASAMAFALAACGSNTGSSTTAAAADDAATVAEAAADTAAAEVTASVETEQAADEADALGFTEYPIFEDEEVAFMNVSAVYFQPVPMSNGNENIEDYNIHLECDVSALENDLGYGLGDWIPYMTVDYDVVADNGEGDSVASGTFMVMSASDGPHYGANVKLDQAGTYAVTFTFHNPEENGYLVHLDSETGPGGTFDEYFADGNLTVTVPGWEYTPQEW